VNLPCSSFERTKREQDPPPVGPADVYCVVRADHYDLHRGCSHIWRLFVAVSGLQYPTVKWCGSELVGSWCEYGVRRAEVASSRVHLPHGEWSGSALHSANGFAVGCSWLIRWRRRK